MSITREEIAELCRQHDRLMAEAASEPIRRSPVSETDAARLVYKDCDNNALLPARQPELEAIYSDDDVADRERWDALNVFSEAATNAITRLQDENIALKAKLDTVLQLLGEEC